MKKSLLALVVASLFPVAAVADVIVYGKANVAIQHADEVADSRVELVSNASRIGLKGGEDINSSLKVIYQFEYQTEVDDGTNGSQTFGQRNIFLGLQGTAGTFIGGHFDTPTKVAQEKVDLFNDLEGDITQIFKGEIRASNIVQYTTPTFGGGFAGSVAYVTEENDGTFKQNNPAGTEPGNGISASFGYTSTMLYVGVAMDQDVEAEGVDLIRVVGRFNVGAFQFGLLAENYDNGVVDEDGVLVSALWNVTDKWAAKAQYGQSDVKMADGESASIGLDYKMTKAATLYSYITKVENEPETRDDTYVGVGLDFKF
ncbi:porin [Cellvibrio mixtus]|jgi:predicted porin|uniref:Porin n=1 Tax=Cellvibrio mixtus TaxID=39650 RepID=A0A266Q705_9GAMM|nr:MULTISPECIES: porin [Cellvibrio]AQT59661.1 porin [Cellvibrio sp. PSBB023]OZY85663.1 porin [Cellvibrio mixtus]